MKKVFISFIIFCFLIVLVSCATQNSTDPLTGIWKSQDPDYDCTFSFTADGFYSREVFSDGKLSWCDFGSFEYDNEFIYTEDSQFLYGIEGKYLLLDGYTYKRKSKIAKNSSNYIKGIWTDGSNNLGFTSSYIVCMGVGNFLKNYKAEANKIKIDKYKDCDYLIINSKLYIKDSANLLNEESVCVFNRQTSTGKDETTKTILVNASPWHLTTVYGGDDHYIYTFTTNGKYQLETYSGNSSESNKYSGSFTYDNNYIDLSDNSDLNFAIVDSWPFMFSR